MRGVPLFWSEEQSRKNFEVVARLVVPGQPERSRLLRKALAVQAGGAPFHVGGKFFQSQADTEWQVMASWVRAAATRPDLAAAETTPPPLDFGFFQTCVQQIFLNKREGRMECVHCHGGGSRGFAGTLPEGRAFWNLEESRRNFEVLRRYVEPGFPLRSRFLTHPLAPEAGGDHYHSGGRRWFSQDDPEWQMLAVRGIGPVANGVRNTGRGSRGGCSAGRVGSCRPRRPPATGRCTSGRLIGKAADVRVDPRRRS